MAEKKIENVGFSETVLARNPLSVINTVARFGTEKEYGLLDQVRFIYGDETADAVTDYFSQMRMPAPEAGEYSLALDGSLIFFLNKHGCVVRMNPLDTQHFSHPNILKPLATRLTGQLQTSLYPGIDAPVVKNRDVKQLRWRLKINGLDLVDAEKMNCGYLPGVDENEGVKRIMIFDEDALKKLDGEFPQMAEGSALQDRLYGPLRALYTDAFPADAEAADPEKVKQFWQECRRMKDEGLLMTRWLDYKGSKVKNRDMSDYKNVHGSENYAARWDGP